MAIVVAEINPLSDSHAIACTKAAVDAGCENVILSSLDPQHDLNRYAAKVRDHYPYLPVGVRRTNGISMEQDITLNAQLGFGINCLANYNQNATTVGQNLKSVHPALIQQESKQAVLVFCFVDAWWQPSEDSYALQVYNYPKDYYIIATTGSTRRALPSMSKVLQLRAAIGETPIALACTMDASQFVPYASFVDWLIVPIQIPPVRGLESFDALVPSQLTKLIQVASRHRHRDVIVRQPEGTPSKRNHSLEDIHAANLNLLFGD